MRKVFDNTFGITLDYFLFRAISVLLGEAWKSLAQEDREQYSQRAKVMADEQKKLFPDCWKRKRTLNNDGKNNNNDGNR